MLSSAMKNDAPTPNARRARRYRKRRAKGTVVTRVEVDAAAIAGLVNYGLLDEADARDRAKIAAAIELVLDGFARNGVALTMEWIKSLPCASRVAARVGRG